MTIEQVANRLTELCRQGKFNEAVSELYDENIVSIEPKGARMERCEGIAEVAKKSEGFEAELEAVNSLNISDPIIAENFFTVGFYMNAKMKSMPEAMQMDEICVYEVRNGKIVSEQFFHTMPEE